MAARGRGQRPIKGFRPGKEPPQLRKRRAKEQFDEMSGAQERLVELFAERTPKESAALLRRWRIWLLSGGVGLGVVAALLLLWSGIAAGVVGALAGIVFVVWWRLHRQRETLEAMAERVGRG